MAVLLTPAITLYSDRRRVNGQGTSNETEREKYEGRSRVRDEVKKLKKIELEGRIAKLMAR